MDSRWGGDRTRGRRWGIAVGVMVAIGAASVLGWAVAVRTPVRGATALAGGAGQQAHAPASDRLTEPGEAAFAAIQEVVERLEGDASTDWSRVDLEALRRHLRDMHDFTVNVEVTSVEEVPGGVRFQVRGRDAAAHGALGRGLRAHPPVLRQEVGWEMRARPAEDAFEVVVRSPRAEDASKIRGLGYIGIMAMGEHHAVHHLAIATGAAPHDH